MIGGAGRTLRPWSADQQWKVALVEYFLLLHDSPTSKDGSFSSIYHRSLRYIDMVMVVLPILLWDKARDPRKPEIAKLQAPVATSGKENPDGGRIRGPHGHMGHDSGWSAF